MAISTVLRLDFGESVHNLVGTGGDGRTYYRPCSRPPAPGALSQHPPGRDGPGSGPGAAAQRQVADTLTLAKQLGAQVFPYKGEDVVETILHFAREYRVGHIVIGKPGPLPS